MILVDDPIWPAHGRRFAHLVSDESHAELHLFAGRLGLPPRAFHRDHYDLPDGWWHRAVAAGAEPVNSRELVRRLRRAGLRRRPRSPRQIDVTRGGRAGQGGQPAEATGSPSGAGAPSAVSTSPDAQAFQKAR